MITNTFTSIARRLLAVSLFIVGHIAFSQEFSAGVNIESPNPNAVLHLVSPGNDQGLLIPKLTNGQRLGMTLGTADEGLLVYDDDDERFYFWSGGAWVVINVGNSNGITSVATNGSLTGDGTVGNELGVNTGTGANQIVQLDGVGNLPAVDGSALTGVTSTSFSGNLTGDVTGTQGATVVAFVGGQNATDVASATNTVNTATALDTDATDDFDQTSTSLGTFTGSTITDNTSLTNALQDLETAVESAGSPTIVSIDVGNVITSGGDGGAFLNSVDDADSDPSNELQTISTDASAGNITLSDGGGTLTLNVDDADSDPTNENQTVSAGTGITVTPAGNDFQVTNAAPDQVVSIADGGSGNVTVGGTYPNFTLDVPTGSDDQMVDQFDITTNQLNLSLEGDGVAPVSVNLAPYLDDQVVSIADGGSGNVVVGGTYPALTIDVPSLDDADSDPTNENQTVSAGTGITVTPTGNDFQVTNAAPDQVVSIADGGSGNVTVGGTYPNFTLDVPTGSDDQTVDQFDITTNQLNLSLEGDGVAPVSVNLAPYLDDQVVSIADGGSGNVVVGGTYPALTIDVPSLDDADSDPTNENQTVSAGTGITVTPTGNDFQVTNAAPDQVVSIADGGSGNITVGGTYPNLTIDAPGATDDQTVDQFDITTNQLNLSLEGDGVAPVSVNLAPYLDDQVVSIADGGSGNVVVGGTYPALTIDVPSLDDADSDPTNENQTVSAGTGITVTPAGNDFQVTNAAPDQVVSIADGGSGNVVVGGAYPALTIDVPSLDDADSDPTNENQTVSAGVGITVTPSGNDFQVINAAPDQVVSIADGGSGNVTVGGTYPSLTIDVPTLNDADSDPTNELQDALGVSYDPTGDNIITAGDVQSAIKELDVAVNAGDPDNDPTNELQDALGVSYDPTGDNIITAGDVQSAIKELDVAVNAGDPDNDPTNELQDALGVSYDPTGDNIITAGDVQSAIKELDVAVNAGDPDNDPTNELQDALGVSYDPTGDNIITAGDVQSAIKELDVAVNAGDPDNDPTNELQDALGVSYDPTGDNIITAGDVQSAIKELDVALDGATLAAGNGITFNTNNVELGGTLSAAATVTTAGAGSNFIVNGPGQFVSNAVGTSITSSTINLGNAGADNINAVGTLNVNENVRFIETTNDLILSVSDQSNAGATLIVPDLGNVTETIATLSDITTTFQMGFTEDATTAAFGDDELISAPASRILQVVDDNNNSGGSFLAAATFTSNATANRSALALLSSRGTPTVNGALAINDILGEVVFNGDNGTNFQEGAYIRTTTPFAWTGASNPAELRFGTAENGTTTALDRMIIENDGTVSILNSVGVGENIFLEEGVDHSIEIAASTTGPGNNLFVGAADGDATSDGGNATFYAGAGFDFGGNAELRGGPATNASGVGGNVVLNPGTGPDPQNDGIVQVTGSSAFLLPIGDDSQRPALPVDGMLRYSTEPGFEGLEAYDGGWFFLGGADLTAVATDIEFLDGANRVIRIADGAGNNLSVSAGTGLGVDGGDLALNAGGSSSGAGGAVSISAGGGPGAGSGISLTASSAGAAGSGGGISLTAGNGSTGSGGDIVLNPGTGSGGAGVIDLQGPTEFGGAITSNLGFTPQNRIIAVANNTSGSGAGGNLTINSGGTTSASPDAGGSLNLTSGNSQNGNGGNVAISAGNSSAASVFTGGNVILSPGTGVSPAEAGFVEIVTTSALKLPTGTTGERLTGGREVEGMIRYNITTDQYEGYVDDGTPDWEVLNGGTPALTGLTSNISFASGAARTLGVDAAATGDNLAVFSGDGTAGNGGNLILRSGNGTGAIGGEVSIQAGTGATNGTINLQTGGASRMLIDGDGYVGIGTTTPQTSFQIEDDFTAARISRVSAPVVNGNFIGSNLFIDKSNASDNEIAKLSAGQGSAIFMSDGQIDLLRVTNPAASGSIDFNNDIDTWISLQNDGRIDINSGDGVNPGDNGAEIDLRGGDGNDTGFGGAVNIEAGPGGASNGNGGNIVLRPGNAGGSGANGIVEINGNTALRLPNGGTAEQPTGADGMIRYNTDLNSFEGFSGTWGPLANASVTNLTSDITFDQSVAVGVIRANDPASGQGNDLELRAANAAGGGPDRGGDIVLTPGFQVGGGRDGRIELNGSVNFGNGNPRSITVSNGGAGLDGDQFSLAAGGGGSGNTNGGNLVLSGGNGQGTGNGGSVEINPGVGTTNGNLFINGAMTLNDGTQQNGYLLTSDATGNASWQAPTGIIAPAVIDQTISNNTNPTLTLRRDGTNNATSLRYTNDPGTPEFFNTGITPAGNFAISARDANIGAPADALTVNGGTNHVGIGTNIPGNRLTVAGDLGVEAAFGDQPAVSVLNNVSGIDGSGMVIVNQGTRSIDHNGVLIQNTTTKSGGSNSNKTGLRIESTGAWGTGGTNHFNIGLDVLVSGGDTDDYAALFNGGNVGINTTSPAVALDVNGNTNVSGNLAINGGNITLQSTGGINVTGQINANSTSVTAGFYQVGGTTFINAARNITANSASLTNTVQASSFVLATPATRYYGITPGEFTLVREAAADDNELRANNGNTVLVSSSTEQAGAQIIAPVHLPHGAEVVSIEVFGRNNTGIDMEVRFVEKSYSTASTDVGSATVPSGTTGISGFPLGGVSGTPINNQANNYFILIDIPTTAGPAADVAGLRVEYQVATAE